MIAISKRNNLNGIHMKNLPITSALIENETNVEVKKEMVAFVQLRLDRATSTTIPDANYPALFVEMGWAKEIYVDFFNSDEVKIVSVSSEEVSA